MTGWRCCFIGLSLRGIPRRCFSYGGSPHPHDANDRASHFNRLGRSGSYNQAAIDRRTVAIDFGAGYGKKTDREEPEGSFFCGILPFEVPVRVEYRVSQGPPPSCPRRHGCCRPAAYRRST